MTRAGTSVGDVWCPGFLCYGIPVGDSWYVQHMLNENVQEIKKEVVRVKAMLVEEDSQAIWTILHCSLSQKLDCHLSFLSQ